MTIWNETFLNKIRDYWKSKIDKIQIQAAADTWADLEIIEKTVEGNTIRVLTRVPDVQFTAVSIRIIDSDGEIAGGTPENIAKTSDDTFYMTFKFSLTQEGEELEKHN